MENIRPTLVEVHIADIHFGAFNPKAQFDILWNEFFLKIQDLQYDILCINGDLFDHKFMANSDAILMALDFVNLLYQDAHRKGATLVLLAGTESHDAGQLQLFYNFRAQDFIIVEQIQFLYIKNKRILAIPELYGVDESVYRSFLFEMGMYDGVIMHGTYKGSIYDTTTPTLNSPHAPIFQMSDFMYCRGPIIAGHVHVPGCFDGHMYYCGSPLRYKFGEEEDKGFIVLTHNLNTSQYYLHFEPIVSYRYDTINMDEYIGRDPKELIDRVNALRAQGIHNLRLHFTRTDDNLFGVIEAYFRNISSVSIQKPDLKKEQMIQAQVEQSNKYNEYHYLFDRNLTPEQILTRYINQVRGCEYITTEELQNILRGFD